MNNNIENNIICAISTPTGIGGIAVIRVSGKGCIELVDNVFVSSKQKKLINQKPNTIHFGVIVKDGNILDEVLVSIFKTPYSFTGEDVVEISCHGSTFIQQAILELLVEQGAQSALRGEFTKRAFLNGKMDLSQAESVADLIASTSAASHRVALTQMRGGVSNELIKLRSDLLNFTSLVELELDFSEEDVEFIDRSQLKVLASNIESHLSKLIASFKLGNAIKSGIPVAIVGETNTGKSTLLNLLLHDEKAIVSDIHGTTRDVIEDVINIKGIAFRLIDTAGIRQTDDAIESIGIERSFKKLEQAAIVLWVVDSEVVDEHLLELAKNILPACTDKKLIIVFNKVDLISSEKKLHKKNLFNTYDSIFISAKYNNGIADLETKLVEASNLKEMGEQDVIITNIRHLEALQKAHDAIQRVLSGVDSRISGDFLSQDIRECIYYIGEITGEISNDDVLGNIFSKFCIGK